MVDYSKKIFPVCCLIIFLAITSVKADSFFEDPLKGRRTIVLDPGHGGSDYGIKGVKGAYEKNITLRIAKLVLKELSKKHDVILTRSGDYKLSTINRAAIANKNKADIFISFHTGGSFNKKASGSRIYYYSKNLEINKKRKKTAENQFSSFEEPVPFEKVQLKHIYNSFKLATYIKNNIHKNIDSIIITGSNIHVLKGADMPSILIEIGFLTNFTESSKFLKEPFLLDYAINISIGVDLFLKNILKKEKKMTN
ncbi:MAG: N-acetylmuramoyl-L-alanine amidase [Desulfobacterales bacterium]|nr:N-acetylmuramoyl-L-alanine amidase [Desulfobacterales bacterium]MCP4164082.1 N-acetylmuramoyl-L-alanine amidase [Deltaproteobacteria bacterium]